MLQTGLIQNAHGDLVTDASYDFYGLRLATCGLDQRIKIWQLDENNQWTAEDEWKAHDAPISKISWSHPEFGSVIASASFDRTVKIWEQTSVSQAPMNASMNGNGSSPGTSSRWAARAVLSDAKGTVRAVEWAPHHFGLKLATIATDNILRIYEPATHPSLTSFTLSDELDIHTLPLGPSPAYTTRAHTMALATPTQTHTTLEGASATLVAHALQQVPGANAGGAGATAGTSVTAGPGGVGGSGAGGRAGNREADGGWCISWCKDKYWGEVIAAGCGTSGVVKIIQLNSRRSSTLLALSSATNTATNSAAGQPSSLELSSTSSLTPSNHTSTSTSTNAFSSNTTTISASNNTSNTSNSNNPNNNSSNNSGTNTATSAITSIAWAPSCGRSYHLIATAGRDGHVRIWKVKPGFEEDFDGVGGNGGGGIGAGGVGNGGESDGEEARWSALAVADFEHHKSAVGRVEWNVTGTILSSAGNDGRIRLWKATSGNVWRPCGSMSVEQAEEPSQPDSKDVEMDS